MSNHKKEEKLGSYSSSLRKDRNVLFFVENDEKTTESGRSAHTWASTTELK